jgi:ferrochelatase
MDFDGLVIVNFGGPRSQDEVEDFLIALLGDQDVIRTGWPSRIHKLFFTQIAKKRARIVKEDYQKIGGASPIYGDTERLKIFLNQAFNVPVVTFHRYLPATHESFIEELNDCKARNLLIFPMFPQFSFATTGSCARFFETHLCGRVLEKMLWISSYEQHPSFIKAYQTRIKQALEAHGLKESQVCLFYSCHGVPKKFVCFNDPYQKQCERSVEALKRLFPQADHILGYQSKFGKGEWLKPYTSELVSGDLSWLHKKHVLFVPLSFTSDHIETLFEVEEQYIAPLKERGIFAARVSSLQEDFGWARDIILDQMPLVSNAMLIRRDNKRCCQLSHGCCECLKKNSFKQKVERNS